ncbi:voltage dependent anion channel 4 [Actinidia rufa]|uniref:Voltage dependent anion channel 4 n=1 Tax=Actinidia rufa TaxID=165716 RepID=A0A7J0E4U2_9ERIC|nr:voltage dependent anion channel 4 [Actinidia rufa]
MATSPAPFSEIGKQVKEISLLCTDLLTKDYNFDQKFTFSVPSSSGMVSTKVTVNDILASTKAALSFNIPDHKSGKLDVHYLRNHATIDSSIGLNPTPLLEVAATLGNKDLSFGGEFWFDTTSSSFTRYSAAIGLNKADFSAALILMDKGKTLKASYIHTLNTLNGTAVAAEMTHRFSSYENSFTIGSSHVIDPYTSLKTRFSDNGKVAMLCQREWRPKSLITFSAEYDSKATDAAPKLDVHYLRDQVTMDSSIGLNPTPLLEVAATLGNKDLSVGSEFELDNTSDLFTKYNSGISFNKADFSASLILMDKGKALKLSYIHTLNPLNGTALAAEMTH